MPCGGPWRLAGDRNEERVRSVAGHKVRARPSSAYPDGSRGGTPRTPVAVLTSGFAPAMGMLGSPCAALRQRGGRWRLREWRLRTKLTAMLLVPLVLAGVLGALRVAELVGKAHDSAALARQVGFAQQLGGVMHDLQGERYRVAVTRAGGGVVDPAELRTQTQRVDSAVNMLRAADTVAGTFPVAASAPWKRAHRVALARLSGLAELRRATLAPNAAAGNAVPAYTELIGMLLDLHRQALGGAPDSLAHQAEGIEALANAQEQASWQHAVLQMGILTDRLAPEQQVGLRTADARFDAAADEFGLAVSPAQQQLYFTARVVVDRKRLLDAVLDRAARGAPLETVPGDWNSAAAGTVETIWQGQSTMLDDLRKDATARGDAAMREAYWDAAVVGLLLLLAVALLIIVIRSLLQPLRALRTAAFEVADRRLPEAIEQLQTAEGAPGPTTVDPVPVHSREELGQVARAVDTVHAQAVRLAAEQAQLRNSLNEVFLILSRRNQSLLRQQLQLINEVRRYAAAAPELVSRLHQLDRLIARMRRYSENLLVLAGGTVLRGMDGRSAEAPMAVQDVLREAVSEIEDGARVIVRPPPAATVAGPIVTDLIHLLAELLDNAISATPRGASVALSSGLTEDKALLVEVTDAGSGLSPDALQAINARLVSTDLPSAGQVGLFVVRELAAKHGITVRLRQRLGGRGVTAIVQLPPALVTVDLGAPATPVQQSANKLVKETPGLDSALEDTPALEDAPALDGQEHLPLRVSVIEDTATDLFSPASISPASSGVLTAQSQGERPRTAQQEWRELFGSQPLEPQPENEPVSALTDSLGIPVSAGTPQVREQIYEMVSAWFRERQSASEDTLATTAPDWRSPFDDDWEAAQALRSPIDHELTQAGLPRRQPRAHLVSGAGERGVPATTVLARTAEDVRGRLSRYQRGLRVGRHARLSPEEQSARTETQLRPFGFDYGSFEEYQQ
jgi:signal transduction histidine kinase